MSKTVAMMFVLVAVLAAAALLNAGCATSSREQPATCSVDVNLIKLVWRGVDAPAAGTVRNRVEAGAKIQGAEEATGSLLGE